MTFWREKLHNLTNCVQRFDDIININIVDFRNCVRMLLELCVSVFPFSGVCVCGVCVCVRACVRVRARAHARACVLYTHARTHTGIHSGIHCHASIT